MGINPIAPMNPFRHDGMEQLTRITPFTYRDGITFQGMLYSLKEYLSEFVVPSLNNELTTIYNSFVSSMDDYADKMIETKAEWNHTFDSFMFNVTENIARLGDAEFSRLLTDFSSKTSQSFTAQLTERVDPLVRAKMASIVGSDRTVFDAASAAVTEASRSLEFLSGTDVRTPRPLESNTGWAIPFPDASGRVMGGFDTNGVLRLAQAIDAPGIGVMEPSRTRVACIGDSLVYGYLNGDSWPEHLHRRHPGVEFINAGNAGASIDEIRFRIGELAVYMEIVGGLIPASGSVAALVKQKIGIRPGAENSFFGTLAGVRGTLSTSDDGRTWTFARATTGLATPCAGKTKLEREDLYANDTVIFWMGRNDISTNATGREPDVISHIVGSIGEMVEHLRPKNKKFLILSILNMASERVGSVNHSRIVEVNRRLQEKYPANFVDIRGYMIAQGIYDAGLTPTAADITAMSEGAPPPQIMDNGSHPLVFMIPHLARHISEHLEAKAYI